MDNPFVHSPNGRFVVMIRLPRSCRSERDLEDELGSPVGQGQVAQFVTGGF